MLQTTPPNPAALARRPDPAGPLAVATPTTRRLADASLSRNTRRAYAGALNQAARDGEIRRRLAAGESGRAVARALRCGLATVQRARSAVEMRGTAAEASGIVPESGPLQGVLPLP